MKTAILGIAALALLPAVANADPEPRDFKATIPAAALGGVTLDANVGSVIIKGGSGDQVVVAVTLKPNDSWFGDADEVIESIRSAELENEVRGDTLYLSLDYDKPSNGNALNEEWTVQVPASLQGTYTLNVGEMEISGVAADIKAEINVGELSIDSDKGEILAEVNVGEIDIKSATGSPGDIDLSVNIGDTRLRINGERIEGERSGWVGADTEYDAGGSDDIEAEVNVGDIRVDIDND